MLALCFATTFSFAQFSYPMPDVSPLVTPKVDLMVTSAEVGPHNGGRRDMEVRITNNGTVDAPASELFISFLYREYYGAQTSSFNLTKVIPAIPAGRTVFFRFSGVVPDHVIDVPKGPFGQDTGRVRCIIDQPNNILEYNESNNIFVTNFSLR